MYKINDTIEAEDRTRFFCKCRGYSVEMDKIEFMWEEGRKQKLVTRYVCQRCGWVVENENTMSAESPGYVVISDQDKP